MSGAPTTPEELAVALASATGFDDIGALSRLTGGASRETWSFTTGGARRILQRQRFGSPRDMHVEIAVLNAAYAGGVPVPKVLASSLDLKVDPQDNALGGQFMVVEAVEGETIARKILRDNTFVEARTQLPGQMGDALGRLHRIDATSVAGLDDVDQIEQYKELLRESGQHHPAFELAFQWLEANRPPANEKCLVHGDFRLGNLIVDETGLRAVLDWELAHLGDPAEDLGWLCVRAWRFGSEQPVAGVGSYGQLLDTYGSATGKYISERSLRWWEVLGTVKWGLMCISQAAYHLNHLSRSHELAAIGRRVCENEYDALLAIRELKALAVN